MAEFLVEKDQRTNGDALRRNQNCVQGVIDKKVHSRTGVWEELTVKLNLELNEANI